jgi:hypothetical protein
MSTARSLDLVRARVTSLAKGQGLANGHHARLSRPRPCERAPFEPHPIPALHEIQMLCRYCRDDQSEPQLDDVEGLVEEPLVTDLRRLVGQHVPG